MSANYSFYSIPVCWILALLPHAVAVSLMKKANNNQWNNANPRGADVNAQYKKTVPSAVFARFERAEAAHKNAMENAPFFVGAILAGNTANLPASTLNTAAGIILGLRVAYIVAYINITRPRYSYLRTLLWFLSTSTTIGLFVGAGNKMVSQA